MDSVLQKFTFVVCLIVPLVSAQIWDGYMWSEDTEAEELLFDEGDDNSTFELKIVKYSSARIKKEKELLEESSALIVNEISDLMEDETELTNAPYLNEVITEQTVQLYNVVSQVQYYNEETSGDVKKLYFDDIFLWSNDSNDKIQDILEDYYQNS